MEVSDVCMKIIGFDTFRESINNVQAQRQSYKSGHQTSSKNPYLTFPDTKTRRPCWRWKNQTCFHWLVEFLANSAVFMLFFARAWIYRDLLVTIYFFASSFPTFLWLSWRTSFFEKTRLVLIQNNISMHEARTWVPSGKI